MISGSVIGQLVDILQLVGKLPVVGEDGIVWVIMFVMTGHQGHCVGHHVWVIMFVMAGHKGYCSS